MSGRGATSPRLIAASLPIDDGRRGRLGAFGSTDACTPPTRPWDPMNHPPASGGADAGGNFAD